MLRKPIIFGSIITSVVALGTSLYLTPFPKRYARRLYDYEIYALNHITRIMKGQTKARSSIMTRYLQYLYKKKGTYMITSSDDENVYVKIFVPFTKNQKSSNIIALRLRHGNHYHIVYIDDKSYFDANNQKNTKYFVIKIPIWNKKLEYWNASYQNEYVNDDLKFLNIWKYEDLTEVSKGQLNIEQLKKIQLKKGYTVQKIKNEFFYQILKNPQIKWKNPILPELLKSFDEFKTYFTKNKLKYVLEQIDSIPLSANAPISLQYIYALKQKYQNIMAKRYLGSGNPDYDWQWSFYNKGLPMGAVAIDFAYDFVKKATEVSGSIFKETIKIDSELYKWWLKNKPAQFYKQFGVPPTILRDAGKDQLSKIRFYNYISKYLDSINYNMYSTKDAMPKYDQSREITIDVYGAYKETPLGKKKYYFDSISTLINELFLMNDKTLPKLTKNSYRNSTYPYLDAKYDSRNWDLYNQSIDQLFINDNNKFNSFERYKFERILAPFFHIYVVTNNNFVFRSVNDFNQFKGEQ